MPDRTVIDLTGSPEPDTPRAVPEIIDLDTLPDPVSPAHPVPVADDVDIVEISNRPSHGQHLVGNNVRQNVYSVLHEHQLEPRLRRVLHPHSANSTVNRSRAARQQPPFAPPQLDYSSATPGILRRFGSLEREEPRISVMAGYRVPSEPRPGFTRSPLPNDVLVCVECDHELGVESHSPKSSEIWTGRCGHCYCGECATEVYGALEDYRKARHTSLGKRLRPKPKICCVKGCSFNLASPGHLVKIHR
jgi:hypothetical protein